MTTPLTLFFYAATLGMLGPRLRWARWPERAPRLAIVIWQAMSVSMVTALVLAGLTLAMPVETMAGHLVHIVEACAHVLHGTTGGSGLATFPTIALSAAVATVLWVVACVFAEVIRASRARLRHAGALAIVGSYRADLGVTVVNDASAAIYCLPGRAPQVVTTSGALAKLSPAHLKAALAHERAHIAGRHDLVVAGAAALVRALPIVPLFAVAHEEVCRLVEMLADDAAGRHYDRTSVAGALAHLADVPPPKVGLAAGGPSAVARVRRLTAPAHPLGIGQRLAGSALVTLVLCMPLALVVGPVVGAMESANCDLPAVTDHEAGHL